MRILTLTVLVVAFFLPALAGVPASDRGSPAADWEQFRHGSCPEKGYVDDLDDGLRKALWAARSGGRLDRVAAEIAKQFHIRPDTAADLIEATLATRALPDPYSRVEPDPARMDRIESALWRAFEREPAVAIVLQQAGWLLFELECDPTRENRVLEALRRSTDPAPFAARLARLGVCDDETRRAAVTIALERRPTQPVLLLAAAALDEGDPCLSAAWAREALAAASAAPVTDEAFLATARNRLLAALLDVGLHREALDALSAIPAQGIAAALPAVRSGTHGAVSGLEYELGVVPVRSALAAAAFLLDERDLARQLAARPSVPDPADPRRREAESERLELVRSAIERLSIGERQDPFDVLDRAILLGDSHTEREFLATKLLFARLARESSYPEIARDLLAPDGWERVEAVAAPQRLKERVDACRARAAESGKGADGQTPTASDEGPDADPAAALIARRLAADPLHPFTERPLPADVTPWEPQATELERLEKELEEWKSSGLWPVRVERAGTTVTVIGLSQDYDPAGEVSGGGYWIVRSRDGGATWDRALYTGLQPMQPYVIRSFSRLPLTTGDRLHIEADLRVLDTSRIIFPPISRSFTEVRTGLFLDVAWADLARDSDGDGLTDLAEERLLTDPLEPDSDGDALPDGADPLPHISSALPPSAQSGALVAVLESGASQNLRAILTGDPGGQGVASTDPGDALEDMHPGAVALTSEATMFLVSDRSAFGGVSASGRIIVLSPTEMETARKRFGVHYPGSFRLYVDHSGTRALAIWNESWRGMTIRLRKEGGKWKSTVVSQWIT